MVQLVQQHVLLLIVSVNKLDLLLCFKFCLATGEGISPKRRQMNDSSRVYYQQGPTTVTTVTEETQVYQIPAHHHQQQQQQNEITYSIQGTQPKFQPVSFLVSSQDQSNQGIIPSYGEETNTTTTMYSQQQPSTSYITTRPNFTKVCQ
jgi:hypothetical protein